MIPQNSFQKWYEELKWKAKDSLKGFDEAMVKKNAAAQGFKGAEMYAYLYKHARNFIITKFGIQPSQVVFPSVQSKTGGNFQTMGPPCNNEDFELGNGSGWQLFNNFVQGPCVNATFNSGATEFWVLPTPIADPQFPGGIPASPLGGNFVAKLNDVNPTGGATMIRQTFPVTVNNTLFQFAWAACFDGPHSCCDNPFLKIRVLDCNNNVLACPQISIVAAGSSCSSGMPGFGTNSSGYFYKNWTQQAIDLTPYIGSCVTIEVYAGDCVYTGHHGYAYFDAKCSPMYVMVNNVQYPLTTSTVFACGVSNATIAAPPGLGPYSWNGPPGSGITNNPNQTFTTSTSGIYSLTINPTGGCGPITRTLNLQFLPTPNAGFSVVNNCQNFTITNTGSGPPSVQSYSFLGSSAPPNFTTTSSATNIAFTAAGQYTILQAVSNGSCSSGSSMVINVPQPLSVGFTFSNVCLSGVTNFTNTTGNVPGNTYYWDFDNNGSWDSNVQNPSYTYTSAGQYTVKLKVTNTSGCLDSIIKVVNVWGHAVPDFTQDPVCFGTPMNFTNTSNTNAQPNTGSIQNYQWYMGDGTQYTTQNPSHLYTTPSNSVTNITYTVTLVVTTVNGCKDSTKKNVTVYSNPTPNFLADSVCLGKQTTLQDLSNGNGNPLFQFHWDFNNDNVPDLVSNSLSTQYPFPSAGNNPVNYTVITNPGVGGLTCKSYTTKNVWVHPSPIPSVTHTNVCVYAQPVPFDASGSSVAFGSLLFDWNFGDGNSLPNGGATPTHSYSNPGTYVFTVDIKSTYGCSVQISQIVDVWDTPKGHFTYTKHCVGKPTLLAAYQSTNSPPVSQFQWDLNNNPSTFELSTNSGTYTFTAPGIQTVNLYLTSVQGCTNLITGSVYVNYNPKPNFVAPKRAGCTDLCIYINDSSFTYDGVGITQWKWDYGNGIMLNTASSASNQICYKNPSHTTNKMYYVKLVVKTDSGCVDSVMKNNYITVYPKPLADFTWEGQDGDLLLPFIQFNNQSIGNFYSHWYFNDGIHNTIDSVNQNPKYYYDTDVPRDYQVWLAVRNYFGCKDTISKYVTIDPIFIIYFPNTFTPNGDNINDFFFGKGVGIKEYKMWIYDRWGEQLYFTDDITKGWDGRKRGYDEILKSDVYVWKAEVTDFRGKKHYFNGHVTLLK